MTFNWKKRNTFTSKFWKFQFMISKSQRCFPDFFCCIIHSYVNIQKWGLSKGLVCLRKLFNISILPLLPQKRCMGFIQVSFSENPDPLICTFQITLKFCSKFCMGFTSSSGCWKVPSAHPIYTSLHKTQSANLREQPSALPPTLELYATPTPHLWLFACIAISPAHLVPCLRMRK